MLARMNLLQSAAVLCVTAMAGLAPIATVHGSDLAEEYAQVKKIALKDPKVRAAFDRANKELDKRIIEIDPALRPFIEKRQDASEHAKKSAAKSTHVVSKGETLSAIARRYGVSVDNLVRANHLSKQATLQVGQKLLIPVDR
jgi:nucleoid-associated protein YgaU